MRKTQIKYVIIKKERNETLLEHTKTHALTLLNVEIQYNDCRC